VEGDSSIFRDIDPNLSGDEFAQKFMKAAKIANHDPYRAVTHNKGIFNGMDAVVIATGNDFRAIEACGHAYASRNGSYGSLSRAEVSGKKFRFSLDVPLAVGTIGGVTGSHPLAAASLEILGHPSAEQLMQIIAAAGLANNFSAVRSLVTSGIQKGHMKMHLGNILRQLNASPQESAMIKTHFRDRKVSYADVVDLIKTIRDQNLQE
jgi:hydroxymethylglutaryl-CoA reductase